ncbi:MAG TPA: NUDIX hydrolase [Burkholderiales bacterium]|nr:NUDIX hydrolase [Burkholderiales bacterium]
MALKYAKSKFAAQGRDVIWKPNLTVAAVIEEKGRFLLVEEISDNEIVINQPAGHVEFGESLTQAVVRETLEETGYHFAPEALIGVYYWHARTNNTTYLRFAFTGKLIGHEPDRPLDDGILNATWLTRDALSAQETRHRSPIVIRCVDDYLAGIRHPLELITTLIPLNTTS